MATILQQPDSLSLSRNLKKVIISSGTLVSFQLLKGVDILIDEYYYPDVNGRVEIDLCDIVTSSLSIAVPVYESGIMEQSDLCAKFSLVIDGTKLGEFTAVRGGVAGFSGNAETFLKANFLTWQPQQKEVLYDQPEWLSFYAAEESMIVKAKFYLKNGTTQEVTIEDSPTTGKVYSLNAQFARLWQLGSGERYGYVDVWTEDANGVQLSYIQRYICRQKQALDEIYLAENSLGGLDTVLMNGAKKHTPEIERENVQLGDTRVTGTIDVANTYSQNTGMLEPDTAKWLFDLLNSEKVYHLVGGSISAVVVDTQSVSVSNMDSLSAFEFTFRISNDKGLLNITRSDYLPETLEIPNPDNNLFFLTPRLIDFPTADPDGELIIPVQTPFLQQWYHLSLEDLKSAWGIESLLTAYHIHENLSLLEKFSTDSDGTLLFDGREVGAGALPSLESYAHKNRDNVFTGVNSFENGKLVLGTHALSINTDGAVSAQTPTAGGGSNVLWLDDNEDYSVLSVDGTPKTVALEGHKHTTDDISNIESWISGKGFLTGITSSQIITALEYDPATYTDMKIAELIGGAPETLDTLDELAAALKDNKDIIDVLNNSISNKVDKVEGKGLSANDFTDDLLTKLNGIESGAEVNIIESITLNGTALTPDNNRVVALTEIARDSRDNTFTGTNTFANGKLVLGTHALSINTRGAVSAATPTGSGSDVLWLDDNEDYSVLSVDGTPKTVALEGHKHTTDDISNLESWISGKGFLTGITSSQIITALEYDPATYTDTKIAELIGGAPKALDTLKEIADAMEASADVVAALEIAIGTKANQSALNELATTVSGHTTTLSSHASSISSLTDQYNGLKTLTFEEGSFTIGVYNPKSSDRTITVPTSSAHLTNNANLAKRNEDNDFGDYVNAFGNGKLVLGDYALSINGDGAVSAGVPTSGGDFDLSQLWSALVTYDGNSEHVISNEYLPFDIDDYVHGTTYSSGIQALRSLITSTNASIPTKVSQLTNDSGFTSNTGTITGIKMNDVDKGSSGVVDLGTVITSHQSLSNYYTKSEVASLLQAYVLNDDYEYGMNNVINMIPSVPSWALANSKPSYSFSEISGTVTNAQLAGSIANSKLANSSITINSTVVSLGGSITKDSLRSGLGLGALAYEAKTINGFNLNGTALNLLTSNTTASSSIIFAPTSAGSNGQVLVSNGSGAPSWKSISEVTVTITKDMVVNALGYTPPSSNTQNTTGAGNTSSKIFLIGATTQGTSPVTYSHDTAYVGTDGCLYSGGAKVLTAHQSLSNYYTKTEIDSKGYTTNVGTVTGIKMNGADKGSSGVVDLGTVITSHQSLSNYYTKSEVASLLQAYVLNDDYEYGMNNVINMIPTTYIKSASVSGSTLTLTPNSGTAITFTASGSDSVDLSGYLPLSGGALTGNVTSNSRMSFFGANIGLVVGYTSAAVNRCYFASGSSAQRALFGNVAYQTNINTATSIAPLMINTRYNTFGFGGEPPASVAEGKVKVYGSFYAYGVNNITSSSKKLKTTFEHKLSFSERLYQIGKVVDYRYNDVLPDLDKKDHIGLIYEDVEESGIMPNMLIKDRDYGALNYLSSDYINLVAGAVQEHTDEITTLKNRVKELETEVQRLKAA